MKRRDAIVALAGGACAAAATFDFNTQTPATDPIFHPGQRAMDHTGRTYIYGLTSRGGYEWVNVDWPTVNLPMK